MGISISPIGLGIGQGGDGDGAKGAAGGDDDKGWGSIGSLKFSFEKTNVEGVSRATA